MWFCVYLHTTKDLTCLGIANGLTDVNQDLDLVWQKLCQMFFVLVCSVNSSCYCALAVGVRCGMCARAFVRFVYIYAAAVVYR